MTTTPTPIPNEHMARHMARLMLNIIGVDPDPLSELVFMKEIVPSDSNYNPTVHRQKEYELSLPLAGMGTIENALRTWARPVRLEGTNCYYDPDTGRPISAEMSEKLDELPNTLVLSFPRSSHTTEPLSLSMQLDLDKLSGVLVTPNVDAKYQLTAFLVGRLRGNTPDDDFILWHGYIRVPGEQPDWRRVNSNVDCLQYTNATCVTAEDISHILKGDVAGLFPLTVWYQKEDADVQVTTPSIEKWEAGWRSDAEYSVAMDEGSHLTPTIAVGIPVAANVARSPL